MLKIVYIGRRRRRRNFILLNKLMETTRYVLTGSGRAPDDDEWKQH